MERALPLASWGTADDAGASGHRETPTTLPETAEEYLLAVASLSAKVPDVFVSTIDPRAFDRNQTPVALDLRTARGSLTPAVRPSKEWQDAVVHSFQRLQRQVQRASDAADAGSLHVPDATVALPPASDFGAWRRLWLGPSASAIARTQAGLAGHKRKRPAASEAPASTQVWMASDSESESGSADVDADTAEGHARPTSSSSSSTSASASAAAAAGHAYVDGGVGNHFNHGGGHTAPATGISRTAPMVPTPPTLSLLLHMDHPTAAKLLEKAAAAYGAGQEDASSIAVRGGASSGRGTLGLHRPQHTTGPALLLTPAEGAWLYALMARLDSPVTGDVAASLRQLYVVCRQQRQALTLANGVSSTDGAAAQSLSLSVLNTLLVVIGRYFAQELTDEDGSS